MILDVDTSSVGTVAKNIKNWHVQHVEVSIYYVYYKYTFIKLTLIINDDKYKYKYI